SAAEGREPVIACFSAFFQIQRYGVLAPGLAAGAANRDDKSEKQFSIPIWLRKELCCFLNCINSTALSKPDSSGSSPAMTESA
ncbi:MAG: hypothetical protein AAFN16_07300, partial [Pseudomonadota bacterium]